MNESRLRSEGMQCSLSHEKVPLVFPDTVTSSVTIKYPIRVLSQEEGAPLSIERFRTEFYEGQQPVVIRRSNAHWKAFNRWRDLSMWCKRFGHRLVPIEIGRLDPLAKLGTDGNWKESTMTLQEYIHRFIQPNVEKCLHMEDQGSTPMENGSIGYLAQHHLFEQLPQLQEDFDIPPYCQVSGEGPGHMEHVKMNAWFGTSGTVTSLHFDSYDNFLTQVFGYKYVRLYSPEHSDALYPLQSETAEANDLAKQNNISPVDVEQPNLVSYPNFATAPYVECVLGPHDMLFIPHQWWHYVRSLSPSFSLNFWF